MLDFSKQDSQSYVGQNVNDKYVLINKLGEDSLTETYLAKQFLHNPSLGRLFQIKFYKQEINKETWIKDGVFEQIKNNISLNSRLVLSSYEYGEWNKIPFTVHDYFEWKTLANIFMDRDNNSISSKFVVSCAIEILKALESLYSHSSQFEFSNEFLHANLSPHKVILSQDTGMVLLADAGNIALYSRACLQNKPNLVLDLSYLSPEQIYFEPITVASDLYVVGLILLDFLCPSYRSQIKALSAQKTYEFLTQKLSDDLKNLHLNDEILKILNKSLNPNIEERYQTTANFISDLNSYLRKQYWVFDIQENIKTVFMSPVHSNEINSLKIEFNKTLVLSTPKELVNSLPLEELAVDFDKEINTKHEMNLKEQSQKVTEVILETPSKTKTENLLQSSQTTENKTQSLEEITTSPSIEMQKEDIKSKKFNSRRVLFVFAPVLFTAFLLFKFVHFSKHPNATTEISNSSIPVVKTIPSPNYSAPPAIIVPSPKINYSAPTSVVLAPKEITHSTKTTVAATSHKLNAPHTNSVKVTAPASLTQHKIESRHFANVSINAVPFAMVTISSANVTEQLTPLSSIKIQAAQPIAINVNRGKCHLKKVVNVKENDNLDLRFNMYDCKEY